LSSAVGLLVRSTINPASAEKKRERRENRHCVAAQSSPTPFWRKAFFSAPPRSVPDEWGEGRKEKKGEGGGSRYCTPFFGVSTHFLSLLFPEGRARGKRREEGGPAAPSRSEFSSSLQAPFVNHQSRFQSRRRWKTERKKGGKGKETRRCRTAWPFIPSPASLPHPFRGVKQKEKRGGEGKHFDRRQPPVITMPVLILWRQSS